MSAPDLPAPLVPAEVDLRGYEFMPLYGDRLLGSQTWITSTPEAKVAAARLWWRAYAKEVPAASLPDDDALLADYAGYGLVVKAWRKVREQALRGFVKCSDGRLYHKVIAPLAIEAFEYRNEQRHRTKNATEARMSRRTSRSDNPPDKPNVTESTGQDRTVQDSTPRSKASARGSRLEPEWEMPQGWVGWAMGEQPTWTIDYAFKISNQFKDYWIAVPGQKGLKLDWEATWRNWVRKEPPMTGRKLGVQPSVRPPSATAQSVEILEGMKS